MPAMATPLFCHWLVSPMYSRVLFLVLGSIIKSYALIVIKSKPYFPLLVFFVILHIDLCFFGLFLTSNLGIS